MTIRSWLSVDRLLGGVPDSEGQRRRMAASGRIIGKTNRRKPVEGKNGGKSERENDDKYGLDCGMAIDGNSQCSHGTKLLYWGGSRGEFIRKHISNLFS